MQYRTYIGFGLLATVLIGCQLLRPYTAPITPTPARWKNPGQPLALPSSWKESFLERDENSFSQSSEIQENTETKETVDEVAETPSTPEKEPTLEEVRRDLYNWWEIFEDPVLNELEEHALTSSYTLWAALTKVIEARAQARINFAPLLPGINFTPSFTRTGSLFQNPLAGIGTGLGSPAGLLSSSGGNAAGAVGNQTTSELSAGDFRFVQTQYLVPLTLNYEIDLWGQLNNAYYASLIRAQAASQAYLSVLLSLTADVASTYFQMRSFDTQQQVIQNNIRVRQDALNISQARFDAGLVTYLDVSRAKVEVAKAYADSADIYRLRGLQEDILATLVGVPAPVFAIAYHPLHIAPPVVPTGLPSELLCRRPDISEAERNLAASYRDIGVAYANFYPSLNLNAAYGFESPFTHQLFSWRSRFWDIGLNLFQTVFDAGRNQANFDYYRARWTESMANYQQKVLTAFQEVQDALVNLQGFAHRGVDIKAAVDAARITLELANMRYTRGLINYLDVVDAERQLLETEQTLASILGNRYISTVMLIKALGGGWGPCETCDTVELTHY